MQRLLIGFLTLLVGTAFAADPLAAFPQAEEGMARHVLHLPKQDDESAFRIELIVGKTVEIDGVNQHFFGGKIQKKPLEGWGYTYYELSSLGPMAGTLMAAPADTPKQKRFVAVGGEPFLIRYNSKLPVVIYVPKGTEVRHRIWRADGNSPEVEPG